MRLRRVEAVRFGGLENATLGDLGDTLTVVLGPNEAGKSTYTALVRAVLYGFRPPAKEGSYRSPAGGRQARLIFEEGGGRWAVERTEGVRGGTQVIRTLAGKERPGLPDEITKGVSEEAFRVVFGFGLDDMARIESSADDIMAPLYAASAGLGVSPHAVRTALDRAAGELFAPAARTKRVHELLRDLKEVRAKQQEVRAVGSTFASERARLAELRESLDAARLRRNEAQTAAAELEGAVTAFESRVGQIEERDGELGGLRRERALVAETLERTAPDEKALAAGADVDALAEQAPVFVQTLRELRETEASAAEAQRRFAAACREIGWEPERVLAADVGPALASGIEDARDALQRLEADVEARSREAERVAAAAERSRTEAATALQPLGIDLGDSSEAALDALSAEFDARDAGIAPTRHLDVPALVLLLAGVAGLAAGLALQEYVSAVIGAVLALAGAAMLVRRLLSAPAARVAALGSDGYRQRRALDGARTALRVYRDEVRLSLAAAEEAALAAGALQTRRALLAGQLAEAGFDGDLTASAAARVLADVKDARRTHGEGVALDQRADDLGAQLDDFSARLLAVSGAFMDVPASLERDDVVALLGRAQDAVARARSARDERAKLAAAIAELDMRIGVAEDAVTRQREYAFQILHRFDIEEGGSAEALRALLREARATVAESQRAFDELSQETGRVEGVLDSLATDDRGAALRLDEAALKERLADAVDAFAVLSVAGKLLERAQARYERERQPDVVKRAESVFRRITRDRYVGLGVPLGEGRIEVYDARSAARPTAELSRGTAEALYLSLRLGLVAHVGDVGPGLPLLMDDVLVNFDPERRIGAAAAVAELSRERQVVVFTCHPDMADLLAQAAPDRTLITLERCGSV